MFMYKISTREFVEMVISTPPPPSPPNPTRRIADFTRCPSLPQDAGYHGKGLLITQRVSLPFSRST